MTLTDSGKDWLAVHAGRDNCFQPSGITFYDTDNVIHTGSTSQAATSLVFAHMAGKDTFRITADGFSYADFKRANGDNDMDMEADLRWIRDNDGGAGEKQYCLGAAVTPKLTKAGKDWIAVHLGEFDCFERDGISYWDKNGKGYTGSTGEAVTALFNAHLAGKDTQPITADGLSYNDFKKANGGDIYDNDCAWVNANDGGFNEGQYCLEGAPPPPVTTPTPATLPPPPPPPPPPPAELTYLISFKSVPEGAHIVIDKKKTYRLTPETLTFIAGTYKIELRKAYFETYKETITVASNKTYTWALVPAPEIVEPVEIEVVKGELKGTVALGRSNIPMRIPIEASIKFRMHIDNPYDGVPAKYKITLIFMGVNQYSFNSIWSDLAAVGGYINLYVDVLLPATAIPSGQDSAFYDLWYVLEAEKWL